MKANVKKLAPAAALAVFATLTGQTSELSASEGSPGISLKAAFASDASCLDRSSYGGVINNCATAREVVGSLQLPSLGTYSTRVHIKGNSSWCQTITINDVGNGSQIGPQTWTTAGPVSWQHLHLGNRYIWADMSILFRCSLEPGGVIGNFNAG